MRTTSGRRTIATLAALTAALAGSATIGSSTQAVAAGATTTAPAQHAHRQAPHRTSLTLTFQKCDSCSVYLQHAISGAGDTVWTSKTRRIGLDHQVTFRMRTRLTHGLSFVLDAPWAGNIGAVPNLVTRYAGHEVGSAVDRHDARHGRRAEGCWAGTRADAATLTFRVDRVRARTPDGQPTTIPLAYSTHTLPSWKPMMRTFKGTIANQDAFYCESPR
ncbi:hypothetical protein [Nocardioides sp. T2.26MG-1]|uniref:hypothetical protein n=1 Tax=Nocardioides sp. T2.26MG-1 TaxID=3041166 RepID=UPI0024777B29|nr:hypothetical protein [Nocardioides sp. T2.26MG-1]CAI9404249.1 hypothetical protein HIDPHFAB_04141 [Nocardioides sp. T2.26MG-1]